MPSPLAPSGLLRGIPQKSAQCHRGGWSKSAAGSHEARGKTLGIVGYGHIGTQVGVLAESLGMQVLFHDIETKLSLGNARASADLDELLAKSDVVTLHVPDTAATRWMIGAAQIARMKPGAHLINAARELSRRVEAFTSLLGPAVVLLMGGVVLFIVLAILLPVFEINQFVK